MLKSEKHRNQFVSLTRKRRHLLVDHRSLWQPTTASRRPWAGSWTRAYTALPPHCVRDSLERLEGDILARLGRRQPHGTV